MKNLSLWCAGALLALSASAAFAYADCTRPILSVWTGYDGARIYVRYADGYADAAMSLAYVNNDEQIVNRTLAAILAGHLAGKSVTFRYDGGQDGSAASCTPSATQKLIGVWVNQ